MGARIGFVATAGLLGLAACGSSGGSTAARTVKVAAKPTTTTEPTAIGLRVNADEKAEQVPDKPLTAAQTKALDAQLAVATKTAERYPTVADITKAGYILAGQFTPGAGAHYVSIHGATNAMYGHGSGIDPADPLAYIYEGTAPTSKIVGLMYASFATYAPSGFAGPNDHWHRHTNLCITFDKGDIGIPFPPDGSVTDAQCKAVKGMFMRRTFWMVHAWVVPTWKSPQGVFSHANLNLHCADGTDHTDQTGFCVGASA
jgi:hypothetical protein